MSDLTQKMKELMSSNTDTTAHKRLELLFDGGCYTQLGQLAKTTDFGGVVTAMGLVEGSTVYAFAQNPSDNLGAMNKLQWQKIAKIYTLASQTGAPVVGIYDSKGASLVNPLETLSAYKEFVKAQGLISGVVPQIAVIAGDCVGTSAVAASSSDIVIMSEKASMYLTSPFTTGGENGTATFCGQNGSAHIICESDILAVAKARELITMLPANNLCPAPLFNYEDGATCQLSGNDGKAYGEAIADAHSATELFANYGKGAYTALATITGSVAGIIATTAAYISSDDASKMASFASFCDCFNIPVVTIVNTKGFEKSADAEAKGELRSAAKLANVFATSTTANVTVIVGNAIGGGYMSLCNGDITIATPSAVISPLEAQTAVAFLYEDKITAEFTREMAEKSYEENEASVFTAAVNGMVDVIVEPSELKASVAEAIFVLRGKRVTSNPKKHANLPV